MNVSHFLRLRLFLLGTRRYERNCGSELKDRHKFSHRVIRTSEARRHDSVRQKYGLLPERGGGPCFVSCFKLTLYDLITEHTFLQNTNKCSYSEVRHITLFVDEATLVQRPAIDKDELMEYGYMISESEKEGKTITVQWWYPVKVKEKLGEIREMTGVVRKIDTSNRRIRVENMDESVWIDVAKIVHVSAN
jgi:hypothetical protein